MVEADMNSSNPFCDARDVEFDFVLVPSKGTFIKDFNETTGLHVALVLHKGTIIDFDQKGVKSHKGEEPRWRDCIKLNIIDNLLVANVDLFTLSKFKQYLLLAHLEVVASPNRWSPENYHSERNNCFDFALTILKKFMEIVDLNAQINLFKHCNLDCKASFCQKIIIPKMTIVGNFIRDRRRNPDT